MVDKYRMKGYIKVNRQYKTRKQALKTAKYLKNTKLVDHVE